MDKFIPRKYGMFSSVYLLVLVFLALITTSAVEAAGPPIKSAVSGNSKHHWYQIGIASWYGGHFQGRKTASGETYDMNALTCAHRSLPLGTWLRVTNTRNNKVVYVRVSDRGPMPEDRIVDLSYAAAQAVGIQGLGHVRLEQVTADECPGVAAQLIAQLHLPAILPFPMMVGTR